MDELLETLLLLAELEELKANPDKPARGTVIEAHMDRRCCLSCTHDVVPGIQLQQLLQAAATLALALRAIRAPNLQAGCLRQRLQGPHGLQVLSEPWLDWALGPTA